MGSLLLVLSLMAVPLMILVAVGYLNWHGGRQLTHRSRWARATSLPATAQHTGGAPTSPERVGIYLRR